MLGNNGLSIFGDTRKEDTLLALAGMGEGRTYYVNNISGDSGNDGLSWNSAFDEVSTAVTASEVYRKLLTSTNEYIRNTIIVQGTGTAYAECAVFPNYANVIGLGATPYGNGAGIVVVGPGTTETGGIVDDDDDCRGSSFYNIQFQAGNGDYCIYVVDIFRTVFEHCAFFTGGNPIGPPAAGFYIEGNAGGLDIVDCRWGTNSGVNSEPYIGLDIHGGQFINCNVENCVITGSTAGIYVVSTMLIGWQSVVRNCYIGQGSTGSTIAIDDNATIGTIHFYDCYLHSSDPIDPSDDASRFVACYAGNAMVAT